jgi:cyclohexanecarboxylate-CoA ligase
MITSSPERIDKYVKQGLWENKTLHSLLGESRNRYPQTLAVADQPNRIALTGTNALRLSFLELDQASTNLACEFVNHGLKRGDCVVVQLPNVVELMVLYMAVSKIGVIISPIPVQYGANEILHICGSVLPKAFITIDRFKDVKLAVTARQLLDPEIPVFAFGNSFSGVIQLALDCGSIKEKLLLLENYQASWPITGDHIITICWTSGTTGTPKGVPRSHNMWVTVCRSCIEAGEIQAGDRLLNPFPMINMAALATFLYSSALLGCSVILHHPLDPALFLKQIEDEKINFTIAPPALLNQLAKSEEMWNQFDFSALRSIGSGSAPLAAWMIDVFDNKYNKRVINFYGSNEGISLVSNYKIAPDSETRASMFPRLGAGITDWDLKSDRYIQTKVLDLVSREEITSAGQVGELVVKGAAIFDGYWDTDNSEVFTSDGYFLTGDLVEICGKPPNYLRIAGRCKDIINRGGMKISPTEIDVLLEGLPNALESAVCSYPDDRLGEKICACVVAASNTEAPDLTSIIDYLSEKGLAKFKLPERLEILDTLPRNPIGKVQRFVLQDIVSKRSKF